MDRNLETHYSSLLGLIPPWRVKKVELDTSAMQIRVAVEYPAGVLPQCPEPGCGRECKLKDHRGERSWRHLDTMQFETRIFSRGAPLGLRHTWSEDDRSSLVLSALAVHDPLREACDRSDPWLSQSSSGTKSSQAFLGSGPAHSGARRRARIGPTGA